MLERLGLADAKGDPIGLTGLCAFLLFPFTLTGLLVLAWVRLVERRPLATIGLTGPGGLGRFLRGVGIGIAMIAVLVPEGSVWRSLLFAIASAILLWRRRRGRPADVASARENAPEVG